MMESPFALELDLGMRWYASSVPGIGGVLRQHPEDFVVEEIAPPPGDEGDHLICRLTKRNWELQRAVKEIARQLGISHRRIGWAGTKDKRAVTTQQISIAGIDPEQVRGVSLKDITLEVIGRSAQPLSLGDLEGNRFTIRIRECEPQDLHERVDALREVARAGLPNYFGLQRFGVLRPVTHVVGRHLLRGEREEAVNAYIGLACEGEPEATFSARKHYIETGDARQALKEMPVQLRYERAMLHHLSTNPGDATGALRQLPPKLLSMFVSAYQSFVFNAALSHRMEICPSLSEPTPGDRLLFENGRVDAVSDKNLHAARMQLRRGRGVIALYIPGSESGGIHGPVDGFIRSMMQDDGIVDENFNEIGQLAGTAFSGTHRRAALTADISRAIEESCVELRFALGPGQYATTVCREFMKADPRRMV